MTNHTAKALPTESGAPSERPETQGDLWREIAEEGYDRTYTPEELRRAFGKPFEELVKGGNPPATAPIIEDGKTLDELVKGDPIGEHLTKWFRSQGATDREIWQFMLDN